MSIILTCAHMHPAIPALTAGVAIAVRRTPHGDLELTLPGTPTILSRIAAAIKDGALILTSDEDPAYKELEREIMAERDRLLARADALLAEYPKPAQLAAG